MNKTFESIARPAQPPRPTPIRREALAKIGPRSRPITKSFDDGFPGARAAPDPAPGRIVDPMITEQLRLFGWVGSSGDATVWLAEHLAFGIPVVVKLLPRDLVRDQALLERFQSEGTALARLRTPHVVQVLERGVSRSGTAYLVMELLEGETLEAALRRRNSLPLSEATEIMLQTGRVLAKARDLRIRCKGIQPPKVFLMDGESGPFVKLTDFEADPANSSAEIDQAHLAALRDLAWRCLAAAPTLPQPIEEWLERATSLPSERNAFTSVREIVAGLEDAMRRAGAAPPERAHLQYEPRAEAAPIIDDVDCNWPS